MIQRTTRRLSRRALSAWDRRFPGFGHDTHGVENRDGTYVVQCLTR
jgi:arginine decarboxylase